MIHRQLGKQRGVRGGMSFACAALFASFICGAAAAGPARCDSGGEGLVVLKDSGACKRITGYIAAGARFGTDEQIGGRPSPFGKLEAPEFVGSARSSSATIIDAPGGQERLFLPPGPSDEAR
jgi:hypothetical protein